ncbi:hypothetical protein K8Z61_04215 [Nocardioides sp. TRM66260-LWL]|uniref:hypothetical protein n=1 Tax=Nocardioides sp. TRM66260-LWL TaxID=2874478 RepID=UPI001CC5FD9C|nr:hypothetical protein [Nocardioides sp. TRM66260-LWL]MBZ5733692.1 hypothetical protein [Nocardioides sp. TRM66260-LWL]
MTRERAPVLVWLGVLTALVLGPLLGSTGYWLTGDMVFVPRQPWKDAWLGGGGALPRAVPMDALVSALTAVVPGWVVQRLLLAGPLLAGGVGMLLLVDALLLDPAAETAPRSRGHATLVRLAGVTALLWSPWVHDRLAMGQWAILAGHLLLPWVALAAHRRRIAFLAPGPRGRPGRGWAGLALALFATAVCSPSSGVMAAAVALAVVASRGPAGRRAVATTAGLALLANLPWLLAAARADGVRVSADGVFAAFAPRAESSAGLLPSLLSLGGTWKSAVVAPERQQAPIVLLAAALVVVGLVALGRRRVGLAAAGERARASTVLRLLAIAGAALVVALLPVLPGGAAALERLAGTVPPVALLRDAERYLSPAALAVALGAASAADLAWRAARPGRGSLRAVAVLVALAPLVLLPRLAWGLGGELRPVAFAPGWGEVLARVSAAPDPVTVVLPWRGSYRSLAWVADAGADPGAAVLDPAPRLLPGEVVVDDRLLLVRDGATVTVPSEDPRVRAVDVALAAPDATARAQALRALGVRFVLVEGPSGGPGTREVRLAGAVVVRQGPLTLLDLSTPR